MKYRSVNRCEAIRIRGISTPGDINQVVLSEHPLWVMEAISYGVLIINTSSFITDPTAHAVVINYGTKDHPEWVYGYVGDYLVYEPKYFKQGISVMPEESFELYWEIDTE